MPYRVYQALKYNPIRLNKSIKRWEAENQACIENITNTNVNNCVFLLNTPSHKNLGDLAIAEAEIKFFNHILPNKQVVEIGSLSHNIGSVDALKKIIPNDAIILFHGGGYIGSDWPHEYEVFRRTVMLFPKNRIILLPQSMFFSEDSAGRAALCRSVKDLYIHNDLHLIAREITSYNFMKNHYKNANIYLVPDMVLTMEYNNTSAERKGILLCMRSDRERLLNDGDTAFIEKQCGKYGQIEYTDTFVPDEYCGAIDVQTRGVLVDAKLEQFGKAELVVTDRLHGMVFAAITGTPCVALSNHNHKVKGTAEWIKDLGYIRYVDDVEEISEAIESVLLHGPASYNKDRFPAYYYIIKELIQNEAGMQDAQEKKRND